MSTLQHAGSDVIRAEIHMPGRGAWWGNFQVDTRTVPAIKSTAAIVAANGFNLTGTVVKAGIFNDVVYTHVVGGAGGVGVLAGPFTYQSAVLGDPLNAILSAARESLSSSVSGTLTRLNIGTWTSTQRHAARLLDELCWVAQQSLGGVVNWRMMPDGTTWIGQETWPTQSLPPGSDVLMQHPVNPWFEIGCETPALMPGVSLSDIGGLNVSGVDHWVDHSRVRSWVWTA